MSQCSHPQQTAMRGAHTLASKHRGHMRWTTAPADLTCGRRLPGSPGEDHMGMHAEVVQPEASDALQHSTDLVMLNPTYCLPVDLRTQDFSLCSGALPPGPVVAACAFIELFLCHPVILKHPRVEAIKC